MRTAVPSHRHWVWRHRAFGDGLQKYRLNLIIMLLPPLLHVALFAFFAGLHFFLLPLHRALAWAIGIAGIILAGLYTLLSLALPAWYGDCPMSTPLVEQLQYLLVSGYRQILGRVKAWNGRSLNEGPSAPDGSTNYHEERLFRSTTVHLRSSSALMWMVNHFRNSHEISVALEAIGVLPTFDHRENHAVNEPEKRRALRDAISFRVHHLSSPAGADSSDAERVGLLRTCAYLTVIGEKEDHTTFRSAELVPQCKTIRTHDAHFVYQAIIQPEQEILQTLTYLENWLLDGTSRDGRDIPVTASSLEIWLSGTVDRLVSEDKPIPLTLGQLATILRCCIFVGKAGDARDRSLAENSSHFRKDRLIRAENRSRRETGIAFIIGSRVLKCAAKDWPNLADTKIAPIEAKIKGLGIGVAWIFRSIWIWGNLFQSSPNQEHCKKTLHAVCAALLGHISSRTAPVNDPADLAFIMGGLNCLISGDSRVTRWTAESLVGPMDLLSRIVRHVTDPDRQAIGTPWELASTTLAQIFHEITCDEDLCQNELLVQRISSIIEDLGKRHFSRSPFSIGMAIAPPTDSSQILSSGQLALLHRPIGDTSVSFSSIWASACRIWPQASSSYSVKLFEVATEISRLLASSAWLTPSHSSTAIDLARDLLAPEEMPAMKHEQHAAQLMQYIDRISPHLRAELDERWRRRNDAQAGSLVADIDPPVAASTSTEPPGQEGGDGMLIPAGTLGVIPVEEEGEGSAVVSGLSGA